MRTYRVDHPSSEQGSTTLRLLLTVLMVILVAVLAGYGSYAWQQNKVNNLSSQVSDLSSQLKAIKQKQSQPSSAGNNDQSASTQTHIYTSQKGVKVIVYAPVSDAKVASPVAVIGEIPGNWSFEASFPVQLKDHKDSVIAQTPAQVLGDWMTSDLVPFSVKLTYSSAQSGSGTLILQKDNPSGLAQNADSVTIPIQF